MTRKTFALLAISAAGAVAGCGGSSKSTTSTQSAATTSSSATTTSSSATTTSSSGASLAAFKSGFAADKTQFTKLGNDLGLTIKNAAKKTDAVLSAEFAALAARSAQQTATLRALNPPAKFKGEMGQLVKAFDDVTRDMRDVSAGAAVHSASRTRVAAVKLVQDAARVKTTDQLITKQLGLH